MLLGHEDLFTFFDIVISLGRNVVLILPKYVTEHKFSGSALQDHCVCLGTLGHFVRVQKSTSFKIK